MRCFDTVFDGMGTRIELRVAADGTQTAVRVFRKVRAALVQLEKRLSYFLPQSDVARLNAVGGAHAVRCHAETVSVLRAASAFYRDSSGAFDITAAPLAALWRAAIRSRVAPQEAWIAKRLPLVCGAQVTMDKKSGHVRLGAGQAVDLGGIAKGFAADSAIQICRAAGVPSAFVNLGGNVHTLGGKPDGSPWLVGVQHPRAPRGQWLGALALRGRSAVTSGDYEQFFEQNGRRYHHIVDPRTGFPASAGLMSATAVCDTSMQADALSTTLFVLGLRRGQALLARHPGTQAVFVTREQQIWVTRGLRDCFFASKTDGFRCDFLDGT